MSSPSSSASSVSPRPSRDRPPPSIPPILRRAHDAGAQGPTPLLTTSRSVFCSRRRLVPVHAGRALGVRLRAAHAAAFVTAALMFVTSRAVQFSPSVPRAPALRPSTRGTAPAACTPTPNRVASARRPGRARPAGSARPLSTPGAPGSGLTNSSLCLSAASSLHSECVDVAIVGDQGCCRLGGQHVCLPPSCVVIRPRSWPVRPSARAASAPSGVPSVVSSRRLSAKISSSEGPSMWTAVPSTNRKFFVGAHGLHRVAQLDRESESRRPSPI